MEIKSSISCKLLSVTVYCEPWNNHTVPLWACVYYSHAIVDVQLLVPVLSIYIHVQTWYSCSAVLCNLLHCTAGGLIGNYCRNHLYNIHDLFHRFLTNYENQKCCIILNIYNFNNTFMPWLKVDLCPERLPYFCKWFCKCTITVM